MPIYAYKCSACGFEKDTLQKMSDAPLTDCPSCGQPTFSKQLTAAGFQLKGSGWYVTDFRNGNSGGAAKAVPKADDATDGAAAKPAGETPAAAPAAAAATPSTPAAAPAAPPATST